MARVSLVFVALSVIQGVWGSALHKNVGVVGGGFINIEEAPFMSLLYTSESVPCAGIIIDREFILTVDNCCNDYGRGIKYWYARVGADGRTGIGSSNKIKEFYKYTKPGTDYNLKPHLCIVKLEKPLKYGEKVNQVNWNDEPAVVLTGGTPLNFTAYGRESLTDQTRGLRRSVLPVSDADWCKKENKRLGGGIICAGDYTHNACVGDAGGALTYQNYLVGLLSEATSDCVSHPSRFSRISYYRDWIYQTLSEHL